MSLVVPTPPHTNSSAPQAEARPFRSQPRNGEHAAGSWTRSCAERAKPVDLKAERALCVGAIFRSSHSQRLASAQPYSYGN